MAVEVITGGLLVVPSVCPKLILSIFTVELEGLNSPMVIRSTVEPSTPNSANGIQKVVILVVRFNVFAVVYFPILTTTFVAEDALALISIPP